MRGADVSVSRIGTRPPVSPSVGPDALFVTSDDLLEFVAGFVELAWFVGPSATVFVLAGGTEATFELLAVAWEFPFAGVFDDAPALSSAFPALFEIGAPVDLSSFPPVKP